MLSRNYKQLVIENEGFKVLSIVFLLIFVKSRKAFWFLQKLYWSSDIQICRLRQPVLRSSCDVKILEGLVLLYWLPGWRITLGNATKDVAVLMWPYFDVVKLQPTKKMYHHFATLYVDLKHKQIMREAGIDYVWKCMVFVLASHYGSEYTQHYLINIALQLIHSIGFYITA